MKEQRKRLTNENKILIMLAFYSISIGLWGNFRQLWLQNNHFNASEISKILSIGTLLCVLGILVITKKLTPDKLKSFLLLAIVIKTLNLFLLFQINGNEVTNLIRFSVMFDVIIEEMIVLCIYPFICTIKKDNTLYSKRKLVEYLFKDLGILIGGMLIGKLICGTYIDYNTCLSISIIFLIIAFVVLLNIKLNKGHTKIDNKDEANILSYVKKHKLIRIYLLYIAFGNIAMNTGLGLKMLMLTNMFGFSDSGATNYLLIIGLIADVIGILALKFFTPKDDYFTVFIKFGLRMIAYLIAFLTDNLIICLLAITWSILISTAYENRIDGQYINTLPESYQLMFNNVLHIVKYVSTAIGMFFAGVTYQYGVRYMLGLSVFFMLFQITFQNTLIYMLHHPKEED